MNDENDMNDDDDETVVNDTVDTGRRRIKPGLPRLSVQTPSQGRRALVKLMREFKRDSKADVQRFRAMIYSFSVVLQYFEHEKGMDIERDIKEIKETLAGMGK
jgi:hypothetical protein